MLLFGVRHVAVREEFDYIRPGRRPMPIRSSVHAHTNNDLWGPQIGGLVDCGHQDVWMRVEGKAAICNNGADRDLEANVNGVDATHPRLFYSGTAMVGDISATDPVAPHPGLDGENRLSGPVVRPVGLGGAELRPRPGDADQRRGRAADQRARDPHLPRPVRRAAIELVIRAADLLPDQAMNPLRSRRPGGCRSRIKRWMRCSSNSAAFSTNDRAAARPALFPGETTSTTATIRSPLTCRTTTASCLRR